MQASGLNLGVPTDMADESLMFPDAPNAPIDLSKSLKNDKIGGIGNPFTNPDNYPNFYNPEYANYCMAFLAASSGMGIDDMSVLRESFVNPSVAKDAKDIIVGQAMVSVYRSELLDYCTKRIKSLTLLLGKGTVDFC